MKRQPVFCQPFGWQRIRGAWNVLLGRANAYCLGTAESAKNDPRSLIIPPAYAVTINYGTTSGWLDTADPGTEGLTDG